MYNYQDWEEFCNYLIRENRYILNDKYKKLIEEILKLAREREVLLEKGSVFWRARTSKGLRVAKDGEVVSDRYTKEEMSVPPKEEAKDGRANPAGSSDLYLAEDQETAIAEIKPFIGDRITIASFTLNKAIKVVDIRKNTPSLLEAIHSKDKNSFDQLWFGIKIYFSVPIKSEDSRRYVPTQYIAELFKNNGCDGIIFDSVQKKDNFNLVLFNPSDAQLNNTEERYIEKIEYIDNIRFVKECLEKQKKS